MRNDGLGGRGEQVGEGPAKSVIRSAAGGQDVSFGLKQLLADLDLNREVTTLAILAVLQAQIVEELSTPGKGRQRAISAAAQRRAFTRKNVARAIAKARARAGRASAPGDPPAPDTGALRGSIQIEYDRTVRKGRVGTNKEYAAPLNFGTTTAGASRKVVILPRPFMEPALKKAETAMTHAGARELRLVVQRRYG